MRDLRTGITFGCFDLCHAGHVIMLEECKQYCDYLIVGLHVDPSVERQTKNKPVQSLFERYTQLRAVKFVDEIIPYQYECEINEMLESLPINVRFLGEDYRDKQATGDVICKDLGIDIVYNKRKHGFSTSDLRQRIKM
jgi:glycerol-3-phosphate cytidylyltransferase